MLTLYAATRNKGPILEVLSPILRGLGSHKVNHPILAIEIASGTGEHASYFTQNIPNLSWLPTELDMNMMDSLKAYSEQTSYAAGSSIISPPIALDILSPIDFTLLPDVYRSECVDFMFCCNMIHISPTATTSALFNTASQLLRKDGIVATYGPYRIAGEMVESNIEFDKSLKARNPLWGVRDVEYVVEEASTYGFQLEQKIEMPSNNLSLIFKKR